MLGVQLPAPVNASTTVRRDGVTAAVSSTTAILQNSNIRRTWSIADRDAVVTTSLVDGDGRHHALSGPDFRINVDGVHTTPLSGWSLLDVTPRTAPALPGRPLSSHGAALTFRYSLLSGLLGVELVRTVVLHADTAVIETTSVLRNEHGPVLRIPSYTLDQITTNAPTSPAEVQAYSGGSDWRDDYRRVHVQRARFNDEGEVVRFGSTSGYFLVSQRRGGVMSRVARDASGRTSVGVDWAKDLFDWGPLRTEPPDYNRMNNPLYPAPVRARLVLPLQSLELGTSYTGVYSGGAQEAAAEFAKDFVGGAQPAFARGIALNTFHPWGHGDGLSDPNLRKQVDLAKSMGVETFMIDDQWQGANGGESGDWRFDPVRFPDRDHDGTADFVEYIHGKGMKLGLWMSPLEFHTGARTYITHPQWACAPLGDVTSFVPDDAGLGAWDATNPGFQRYIVGVVDRLVSTYRVSEFKFDFMTWLDCGTHDYADYEDAFVQIVRAMQRRHPNVTFELDETNDQRSWPFESAALGPSWFDNAHLHGHQPVPKLLHDIWTGAPWVPTWSLGMGTADGTLTGPYAGVHGVDTLMPIALLTHITFWTDLTKLTPAQRTRVAYWTAWYRDHREALGPVIYELTSNDPLNGKGWAAFESWNGSTAYVFAFRQAGGPSTMTLQLHGMNRQVNVTLPPYSARVSEIHA